MDFLRALAGSLRSGAWIGPERIRGYSILLIALSALAIVALWTTGDGLKDGWGRPIGTDFANPYSAGRMALDGRAAEAYDYAAHFAEQRTIFDGGPDHPFYSWPYPPIYFLIAAPLAALPYLAGLAVWLASTFTLYLAAVRAILPHRLATLAAAAFPAVFITVGHGHNSFLTAGLLGLGLARLDRQPWLAGMLFGCLAYKPHLGLVLPLILVAGRRWSAFVSAALTVVALCAASVAAFGVEPWRAFLASGEVTRTVLLEEVSTGWFKIQSVFSAVRGLGGPVEAAYGAQALLALGVLAALAWLWNDGGGALAKAATCIGALLVTPYMLDYDMALLAPAGAFLVAKGLDEGFQPYERSLFAAAWAVPLLARPVAQHLGIPIALIVMTSLFLLIVSAAARQRGLSGRAVPAATTR